MSLSTVSRYEFSSSLYKCRSIVSEIRGMKLKVLHSSVTNTNELNIVKVVVVIQGYPTSTDLLCLTCQLSDIHCVVKRLN
jgi:hypothetical protein